MVSCVSLNRRGRLGYVGRYKFNIVNLEKSNSQFNFGMQPVMWSTAARKHQNKVCHRECMVSLLVLINYYYWSTWYFNDCNHSWVCDCVYRSGTGLAQTCVTLRIYTAVPTRCVICTKYACIAYDYYSIRPLDARHWRSES